MLYGCAATRTVPCTTLFTAYTEQARSQVKGVPLNLGLVRQVSRHGAQQGERQHR